MLQNHIKNIAILGAAGKLGSQIVDSLLATKTPSFHITAITRSDSSSTSGLPPSDRLSIVKGSYSDQAFLTNALQGQDALIIALGFATPKDLYPAFHKAAADAGVPYILPTEFGSDTGRAALVSQIPVLAHKTQWRADIERLGVSAWIAVVTNPWLDMALPGGLYSIDAKNRKATIYDGGDVRFNATTLAMVAAAVARVLALPISAPAGEPSLERYKNGFVYVRSVSVSQNELLASVQRVTGSDGSSWDVTRGDLDAYVQQGRDKVDAGDFSGNLELLFGTLMQEGVGNDYSGPLANDALRLPEEDLDEVVRRLVPDVGA